MYNCPCGASMVFPHKFYSGMGEVEVLCTNCDPGSRLYPNLTGRQDYSTLMYLMVCSTENTETKLAVLESWYEGEPKTDSSGLERYNMYKKSILEEETYKHQDVEEKLQNLETWYSQAEQTPKNKAVYREYKRWLN